MRVSVPLCSWISSRVGGGWIAQDARLNTSALLINQHNGRTGDSSPLSFLSSSHLLIIANYSMEFQDQPIELGADPQNDLAQDVYHVAAIGIYRTLAFGARCQEKIPVLCIGQ